MQIRAEMSKLKVSKLKDWTQNNFFINNIDFIAWKLQNDKVALVKDTIDSFGWNYDPSNPLNKEEQKKAWLSQSQKNVKAKTAIEALGWEYVS